MAELMISTDFLTKCYKGKAVVNEVNMQVRQGSIAALVGQNGAGKTTLIRMLTGLVKPTSGHFELLGGRPRNNCDVAAIVERPSIYTSFTAMDNLIAQSTLLGLPINRTYLSDMLLSVGLDPSMKKVAKNFSLGMKQRLAIAMTLVGKPKLLILDEPTNGLDPQGIVDMRELFVRMSQEQGITILISSHILSELGKFATDFYIMDNGRLIKQISREELMKQAGNVVFLTVDNVLTAVKTLREFGEANAVSTTEIHFKSSVPVAQALVKLSEIGVNVSNIKQDSDPLEAYYMRVIHENQNGGAR